MPTTFVRRALAIALGAVTLLASCTGSPPPTASGPEPTGSESASAESSPAAEPTAPALPPGVVATQPDGTLTELGRIEVGASTFGQADGGFVWTDDAVVMVTERRRVVAIDRATSQQRWSIRVPKGDKTYDQKVCRTPTPPPGATAVKVVVGVDCDQRYAYELASGEQPSMQTLTTRSPQEGARVGDWTYYIDREGTLFRLERDGSASSLGPLDLPGDQSAGFLSGVGDALIVKTEPADSIIPHAVTVASSASASTRRTSRAPPNDSGTSP